MVDGGAGSVAREMEVSVMGRLLSRSGPALSALTIGLTLVACGGDSEDAAARPSASIPVAPSSSPAAVTPAPGDHDLTLVVSGVPREYRLHAPPSYDPSQKLPLVLAFHCMPCEPADIEEMSKLSAKADEENFIVVYPDGKGRRFTSGDDDFVESLLDEVESTWGTDPRRVYATGISNGASMAFRVGADLPGRFAAIAPVSGPLHGLGGGQLPRIPQAGVSMIVFTGRSDSVDVGMKADLPELRNAIGCVKPSVKVTRGARPVTISSATCNDDVDIVWYRISGMGHAWPGASSGLLRDPDGPINATNVIWDFFKAHPQTT
jgi:polyhydroxybutyrate depolymerase